MKTLGLAFLSSLLSMGILSHSGGLDENSCHGDKKNNFYHCHLNLNQSKQTILISSSPESEKAINKAWCDNRGGISEFRTKDGTYVDCLTDIYSVEAEFENNWKEAIGQSLHYAESTNKKAAILLIKDDNSKIDYLSQLQRVIKKFELPITLYLIDK